jgi:hypothetical protein
MTWLVAVVLTAIVVAFAAFRCGSLPAASPHRLFSLPPHRHALPAHSPPAALFADHLRMDEADPLTTASLARGTGRLTLSASVQDREQQEQEQPPMQEKVRYRAESTNAVQRGRALTLRSALQRLRNLMANAVRTIATPFRSALFFILQR